MNLGNNTQKLQHNLHKVAVMEDLPHNKASLEPYNDYSPAEAVDVIAQYHSYADVQHHQKQLWRLYQLAITNSQTPDFREDYIGNLTCEYEQLAALIAATNSLYC